MADSPAVQATGAAPVDESPAQRAARIRREKRNAKILTEGSDRISKITSLGGRAAAAEADLTATRPIPTQPSPRAQTRSSTNTTGGTTDDPAEVDISQMFQRQPPELNGQDPQALFRQMLMGAGPQEQGGQQGPNGAGPSEEDPMMRIMQQLMGGAGAGEGGAGGLPPGLASMFGGQQQPEPDTNVNNIWRIVHAAFALLLGLYAAVNFTFTGTKAGRVQYSGDQTGPQLFWIFATLELVLQSSRYFIDGGKLPVSGILGGLGAFLPEPYANYVRIISRYSIIYTTVVADAMVTVFILGCVAWWKGLAAS